MQIQSYIQDIELLSVLLVSPVFCMFAVFAMCDHLR